MYPMVHIKWKDAASPESGWLSQEVFVQQCSIMEAHTLGFLVSEDEDQVRLCQSFFPEDGQMSCGIAIPKKWILSIEHLPGPRKGKPRKKKQVGNPEGPTNSATVEKPPKG